MCHVYQSPAGNPRTFPPPPQQMPRVVLSAPNHSYHRRTSSVSSQHHPDYPHQYRTNLENTPQYVTYHSTSSRHSSPSSATSSRSSSPNSCSSRTSSPSRKSVRFADEQPLVEYISSRGVGYHRAVYAVAAKPEIVVVGTASTHGRAKETRISRTEGW